jgi:integrase
MAVTRAGIVCNACWQKDPARPFVYVAGLARRLEDPPDWLEDFAAYAAARFCPSRATSLLRALGRLHTDGARTPAALLEASRWQGRSEGPLARTLESFFVDRGLALPTDREEQLEKARRERRLAQVPQRLRPAVIEFADSQLRGRERARRAGTSPSSHRTIDIALCTVRDLAIAVTTSHPDIAGWETVSVDDIEQFLTARPASRTRSLAALRKFFSWARRGHLILIDPTRTLRSTPHRGFTGPVIDLDRQRELFRRWSSNDPHPHEALVGLLCMLHAASAAEIRQLRIDDIDGEHRAVRLGQRPHPVPLDPATWTALRRCLDHREKLATLNPHVVVTKITATRASMPSQAYLSHVLDPAGIAPRHLRSNRLADMIATSDPLMVVAALGVTPAAVTWYLGDTVDEPRLPEPSKV